MPTNSNLLYPTKMITPEHDEDYDSDGNDGIGNRRLSRVADNKLRRALEIVRNSSQRELKEECLRNEWYTAGTETEKSVLKDCIADEQFWEEVKELARGELETTPDVLGEEQFRQMFKEFDADGSGSIDAGELRQLLSVAMGMDCSEKEVMDLMSSVDTDGNGEIDEQEFLEIMNAALKQQEASAYLCMQAEIAESDALRSDAIARDKKMGLLGSPASPSDRSRQQSEASKQLTRKASLTGDKAEQKQLLGRATVEEYKDMLKQRASQARDSVVPSSASPSAGGTSSSTTPQSPPQLSVSRPPGSPCRDSTVSAPQRQDEEGDKSSPTGRQRASTTVASTTSPRPALNFATRSPPTSDISPRQHQQSPTSPGLREDSGSPPSMGGPGLPPPRKNKPRAYSSTGGGGGKSSVPSYMRNTQSSRIHFGKK